MSPSRPTERQAPAGDAPLCDRCGSRLDQVERLAVSVRLCRPCFDWLKAHPKAFRRTTLDSLVTVPRVLLVFALTALVVFVLILAFKGGYSGSRDQDELLLFVVVAGVILCFFFGNSFMGLEYAAWQRRVLRNAGFAFDRSPDPLGPVLTMRFLGSLKDGLGAIKGKLTLLFIASDGIVWVDADGQGAVLRRARMSRVEVEEQRVNSPLNPLIIHPESPSGPTWRFEFVVEPSLRAKLARSNEACERLRRVAPDALPESERPA